MSNSTYSLLTALAEKLTVVNTARLSDGRIFAITSKEYDYGDDTPETVYTTGVYYMDEGELQNENMVGRPVSTVNIVSQDGTYSVSMSSGRIHDANDLQDQILMLTLCTEVVRQENLKATA